MLGLLAAFFLVLGGIGFFLGLPCAVGWLDGLPQWIEFPLGEPEGIAVDAAGRVYLGLQFYHRVQVYDAEGRFLRGFFVNSGGGVFRIRINSEGRLDVAATRGNSLTTYELDGTEVAREVDPTHRRHYYSEFGEEMQRRAAAPHGTEYHLVSGLLFPRVDQVELSGDRRTVIRTDAARWFLKGPFPAGLFWGLGIAALIGLRALAGKRVAKEARNAEVSN